METYFLFFFALSKIFHPWWPVKGEIYLRLELCAKLLNEQDFFYYLLLEELERECFKIMIPNRIVFYTINNIYFISKYLREKKESENLVKFRSPFGSISSIRSLIRKGFRARKNNMANTNENRKRDNWFGEKSLTRPMVHSIRVKRSFKADETSD